MHILHNRYDSKFEIASSMWKFELFSVSLINILLFMLNITRFYVRQNVYGIQENCAFGVVAV